MNNPMNGNGILSKQFNEGAAQDSVQFRPIGEPPLASTPLVIDGFTLQIYSGIDEQPPWWSRARDRFNRNQIHEDSLLAGVIYGEVQRVKNMPFTLTHEDDNQEELTKWQRILQLADFGNGLPSFTAKLALDFLSQDNGAFFEILGGGVTELIKTPIQRQVMVDGKLKNITIETEFLAKGELTGKATGLAYLDSAQCWRTMNPEWPVIYQNPYTGRLVTLHWTRVYGQADLEQGYELGRGIGLCAVSRSYPTLRQLKSINRYFFEKITGRSPEIFFASTPVDKMENAIKSALFNNDNKGFQVFRDPIVLAPKSGGVGAQELKFGKMGLLDTPDGFSYREQVEVIVQTLANDFGVDVREIWAQMQSGSTKADAEVQDIKTTGKGRASILSMIENALNWRVLPPEITFRYDEIDDLSDKRKAEIKQIRVNTRATQVQSGELSIQEAREMAAEVDDILPEFLERVATADEMTDVEAVNPTSEDEAPKELPDENEDEAETEETKALKKNETIGQKAYTQTRALFFRNLVTFCELAVARQISSRNFMSSLKGELRLAGRAAFLDGVRTGAGNFSIGENELSPDEVALRDGMIETQISYAGNLRDFAFTDPPPEFVEIISRIALWSSKGLDGIYNAGRLAGAKNKVMGWRLGFTEKHCKTCLAASKQRHRASTWAKYKLMPKGDNLECGGFKCDCELFETNERVTGNIQRIPVVEGKHIH